ncbi:high nitrogen upregulated cytochrome P450 monooxygenase 2 [Trametes meyenii]|nr:high nitrogen upregulated cytochrome P450 monooxygenase 2 [Trametes meyenii]
MDLIQGFSQERAFLTISALSLITHQAFKYLETFSIAAHILLLCVPLLIGFLLLLPSMAFLHATFFSAGVFLATLLTSVTVYRLSPFHPLARYPGPLGCRLSKFWMAYRSLSGHQHLYIQRLHNRYGNIVRTGPNELSIKDPSLIGTIFGTPGLPKGPLMVGRILTATDLPMIGLMDPVVHAERRKPWNRAFSATALKEYEPLIASRVSQLVQVLERQVGEFDIGRFMNYFTYDFMCDMAYGGGSELLRDGDKDSIWATMETSWPAATFLGNVPWLGPYVGYLPAASASVNRMLSYCRTFTLERIKRGSIRKDVFHYLNNEDQPEKGSPPVRQLIDDGVLAIVAGADTTSSALSSLFFCLATHPEAYKCLQAEIDRFYPPGDDPCDPKNYRNMSYLTAVIHETLRLYPPVPGGMQRQVPNHSGGAMLGPNFVPGGTSLYMHTYSMHRDPRNFSPQTDDFWPERWLLAAKDGDATSATPAENLDGHGEFVHNDAAFNPFSHGPGNCVGKQLAMQEMRTVVNAIVQKFEVRLREGWDTRQYDEGFKDYFVTTRPAVPITLRARF